AEWERQRAEWRRRWDTQQRAFEQQWNRPRTLPRLTAERPLHTRPLPYTPHWTPTPFNTPDWGMPHDNEEFWFQVEQNFGEDADSALTPSTPYEPGVDDLWSPQAPPVRPISRPQP